MAAATSVWRSAAHPARRDGDGQGLHAGGRQGQETTSRIGQESAWKRAWRGGDER